MEEEFSQRVGVILFILDIIIKAVKEARPTATDEQILYCLLKEYEG